MTYKTGIKNKTGKEKQTQYYRSISFINKVIKILSESKQRLSGILQYMTKIIHWAKQGLL